jgi:hypothetical protein
VDVLYVLQEMDNITHVDGLDRTEIIRYAWPTPSGVLIVLAVNGVAHFMGQRAYLMTHAWFELVAIIPMVASIIFTFRLARRWRSPHARWLLLLNLCFGPLLVVISVINLLILALSAIE